MLGMKLDSTVTFVSHINDIIKVCSFDTDYLCHLRRFVPHDVANSMACSIVGSKMDYCNSLLHGVSNGVLEKLQLTQSHLHVWYNYGVRNHNTIIILCEPHWPVHSRVIYKIALTSYRAYCFGQPPYLEMIQYQYIPSHLLHSSDNGILTIPASKTEAADLQFSCAAPGVWSGMLSHGRFVTLRQSAYLSRI